MKHILEKKTYSCKQCLKWFSLSQHLKTHLRTHNGETPYLVVNAPSHFIIKVAVRKKPFSCKERLKPFYMLHPWRPINVGTHSGENPYSCKQCLKWFSLSQHLDPLKRTHNGETSLSYTRKYLIQERNHFLAKNV